MSGSHEKLPMIFWVQIALVLIVATIYLMTPAAPKHHDTEASEHEVSAETKTALKPVGEVTVKAEAGASGDASRSGEDIVKKTCAACHIAGIANAPKLDASAKDAWTTRMTAEKDLDGLVTSAKKGKNGMPPNGADPSLSDAELKAAIVYMLNQVGVEVAAEESVPAKAESKVEDTAKVVEVKDEATEKPAVATIAVLAKEEVTDKSIATPNEVVEEKPAVTTEEVKEPLSPAEPTVPVAPATVTAPAAPKAAAMPAAEVPAAPTAPKAENQPAPEAIVSTTEESEPVSEPVTASVVAPSTKESKRVSEPVAAPISPPTEESQPASEPAEPDVSTVEEAKSAAAVALASEVKSVVPTANDAVAVDLVAGEKTYKSICFSCHDMAVANAPKLGDKVAWASRIAKGMDVLYNTALKGDSKMPAMPAKGGNPNLSDSDVKNAVSYMVELSK